MSQTFIIDPPNGWMYNFPKVIPEDQLDRVNEWLVENGYPQKEIDALGDRFFYRCWVKEDTPIVPTKTFFTLRREDIHDAVGIGLVSLIMSGVVDFFLTENTSWLIKISIMIATMASWLIAVNQRWINPR